MSTKINKTEHVSDAYEVANPIINIHGASRQLTHEFMCVNNCQIFTKSMLILRCWNLRLLHSKHKHATFVCCSKPHAL